MPTFTNVPDDPGKEIREIGLADLLEAYSDVRTRAPQKKRRGIPIDENRLRQLWPTRISTKKLEEEMGRSWSVIYKASLRLGLRPRRFIWDRQEGRSL